MTMFEEDIAIELAIIEREALAAIRARMAAQCQGEAFKDLPAADDAPTMNEQHNEKA